MYSKLSQPMHLTLQRCVAGPGLPFLDSMTVLGSSGAGLIGNAFIPVMLVDVLVHSANFRNSVAPTLMTT